MVTLPADLTVDLETLSKRSLYVAYPSIDNRVHVPFHQSMAMLLDTMGKYGLKYTEVPLAGDSLITRARNHLTQKFWESAYTNFMFIDSDIGFDPMHVLHMFALQTDESRYDVIGAVYPRKTISWELLVAAIKMGHKPGDLHKYIGDFVFNPLELGGSLDTLAPSPVGELGTGFMMIKRDVLRRMRESGHPERFYKPDHMSWEKFKESNEEWYAYWRDPIDPKTKRHMSEDYQFCQDAIELGMNVWVCPWVGLTHYGQFAYSGMLSETLFLLQEIEHAKQRSLREMEQRQAKVGKRHKRTAR